MKVKFWCDSGANIHSCRTEEIDLLNDWNMTDEEWNSKTYEEKSQMAEDWANDSLDIGYEEIED
jgi:hypothetical protein